jgi:hypothetical protein
MEKEKKFIKILSVIKLILAILTLISSAVLFIVSGVFAVSYADDNELRASIESSLSEVVEKNPKILDEINKMLKQNGSIDNSSGGIHFNIDGGKGFDSDTFSKTAVPVLIATALVVSVIKGIGAIYNIVFAAIGLSIKKKPNKATAVFVLAVISVVANALSMFSAVYIGFLPVLYNVAIAFLAYAVMKDNKNKLAQEVTEAQDTVNE